MAMHIFADQCCMKMTMGMWLLAASICCLAVFPEKGHAQIPAVCATADNLQRMVCCPDNCGQDEGRGECVDVRPPMFDSNSTDVRGNWPHYFTRACNCSGNYYGVDCTRCKYGYYGDSCELKQKLERRSTENLSVIEWNNYINILKMARNYDSDYAIVVRELENTTIGATEIASHTVRTNLYNFFVWLHHYSAKDNERTDGKYYLVTR